MGYPALYFEIASVVYPEVATLATTSLLYLFLRWKNKEKLFFIVMLIVGSYAAFTGATFDIISLAIAIVALTTKGWIRSTLMALSGDIKQYTLFYLPFMWKDYWGKWKELAKNVVIPFAAFLIPNLPFISFKWAFDVLGPLVQPVGNQGVSISLLSMTGVPIPHIAYNVAPVKAA